jgi:hypothetical protein
MFETEIHKRGVLLVFRRDGSFNQRGPDNCRITPAKSGYRCLAHYRMPCPFGFLPVLQYR